MTLGYRRCISIPINKLWFKTQLYTKHGDSRHVTGRFEENIVRVSELNVSPKFVLVEQDVLNVKSTQTTVSPSNNNISRCF